MIDVMVNVLPNGDAQVSLIVKGPNLPVGGQRFDRPLIDLSAEEIEELRRGTPKLKLVETVSDRVSTWLMSGDLKYVLTAVLGYAGDEPVRLVFAVDDSLPKLADVPVELLFVDQPGDYLVLDPRVSAIVHLLSKVEPPQPALTPPAERLRVLIVRSNPSDLGGAVPTAAPLSEEILAIAARLGPDRVRVDLLSSEPSIDRPATWEATRTQLEEGYDILVYLGHGDMPMDAQPDEQPLGVLYFETVQEPGGEIFSDPITSIQLKRALTGKHKVPVVLLVGCLTAANLTPEIQQLLDQTASARVRGSQGVAQQLVNSVSGVQIAVGMRYRLETEAADQFLRHFFRSLIEDTPGNVEAAVRAGREELFKVDPHPPSWSAPVVFRAPGPEPFFSFLAMPAVAKPDRADERDQKHRVAAWETLIKQPLSARLPDSLTFAYQILDEAELEMRQRALTRGALLMPGRAETGPNTTVTIPVALHGALDVEKLEGAIVVGGETARIESIQRGPALQEAGYRVVSDLAGDNQGFFRIEAARPDAQHPLPEGDVLTVRLALDAAFPLVYPVGLETLATDPPRPVQAINNAVIVPAP